VVARAGIPHRPEICCSRRNGVACPVLRHSRRDQPPDERLPSGRSGLKGRKCRVNVPVLFRNVKLCPLLRSTPSWDTARHPGGECSQICQISVAHADGIHRVEEHLGREMCCQKISRRVCRVSFMNGGNDTPVVKQPRETEGIVTRDVRE